MVHISLSVTSMATPPPGVQRTADYLSCLVPHKKSNRNSEYQTTKGCTRKLDVRTKAHACWNVQKVALHAKALQLVAELTTHGHRIRTSTWCSPSPANT